MNDLVEVDNNEPVTTSLLIAKGVGRKHDHVKKLISRYSHREILSRLGVREVPTKGRPQKVVLLTERQATFLMTLMDNSPVVADFKEKLVNCFFDMRSRLNNLQIEKNSKDYEASRVGGKISRREGTDVIKHFIEYAKNQGSSKPDMYYMSLSKMENKALWIIEGKFDNVREALSGQQLQVIASADLIAARALTRGMNEGKPYKDIYKMARDDVMSFAGLIGQTCVPMGITFTQMDKINFKVGYE